MESAEGGRPRPRVARQKDISDLDQVTQDTASATSSPEGVRARIGLYENLSKGVAYQVRRTQSDMGQRAPPAPRVWERSVTFVDTVEMPDGHRKLIRTPTPYWGDSDDDDGDGDDDDDDEGPDSKDNCDQQGDDTELVDKDDESVPDKNGEVMTSTAKLIENCDLNGQSQCPAEEG